MSLRQGLLALLDDPTPKHGYQLKTEFEAATGGMWRINVGQIYSTLERLQRDGFVAMTGDDDQKRYALTDDGRQQVGAWWRALPADEPPPRDELMVKVLLAIATVPRDALDVITAQRTALIALLQRRRRAQRAAADQGSSIVEILADEALVVRAEADLRWLDLCEARITLPDAGAKPTSRAGRNPPANDANDRDKSDSETRTATRSKGRRR